MDVGTLGMTTSALCSSYAADSSNVEEMSFLITKIMNRMFKDLKSQLGYIKKISLIEGRQTSDRHMIFIIFVGCSRYINIYVLIEVLCDHKLAIGIAIFQC